MTKEKALLNVKSGKVPVPGGEIYFEAMGEGEPLILIHAGFSDRGDWSRQVGDLQKSFAALVYDQRGSGCSSVIASAFAPADDLKALMDHLKISKAAIVGHSIGGTIALDFALRYPERVSALVLLAPGLNGHSWSQEYMSLMQSVWSVTDPSEMTKRFLSAPFYAVAMSDLEIKTEVLAVTQRSLEKVLTWKTFDPRDIRWFFPNAIPHLDELQVPALVICGEKDSQDIQEISELLGRSMPRVKVEKVPGADHLLNFEKPHEINSLIREFLECLLK